MLNNNEIYGSNLDPGYFVVTQIFQIKKHHGNVKRPRAFMGPSIALCSLSEFAGTSVP